MSRPKRPAAGGLVLHVVARSSEGRAAFESADDYRAFLALLRKYEARYRLKLYSYNLLPDHFHLLLSSDIDSGIPRAMRDILGTYSRYYNRRHKRRGTLWEPRYRAEVVEREGGGVLLDVASSAQAEAKGGQLARKEVAHAVECSRLAFSRSEKWCAGKGRSG